MLRRYLNDAAEAQESLAKDRADSSSSLELAGKASPGSTSSGRGSPAGSVEAAVWEPVEGVPPASHNITISFTNNRDSVPVISQPPRDCLGADPPAGAAPTPAPTQFSRPASPAVAGTPGPAQQATLQFPGPPPALYRPLSVLPPTAYPYFPQTPVTPLPTWAPPFPTFPPIFLVSDTQPGGCELGQTGQRWTAGPGPSSLAWQDTGLPTLTTTQRWQPELDAAVALSQLAQATLTAHQ